LDVPENNPAIVLLISVLIACSSWLIWLLPNCPDALYVSGAGVAPFRLTVELGEYEVVLALTVVDDEV
jgi:hypothetical protein